MEYAIECAEKLLKLEWVSSLGDKN
jgi:hypothetical protein